MIAHSPKSLTLGCGSLCVNVSGCAPAIGIRIPRKRVIRIPTDVARRSRTNHGPIYTISYMVDRYFRMSVERSNKQLSFGLIG